MQKWLRRLRPDRRRLGSLWNRVRGGVRAGARRLAGLSLVLVLLFIVGMALGLTRLGGLLPTGAPTPGSKVPNRNAGGVPMEDREVAPLPAIEGTGGETDAAPPAHGTGITSEAGILADRVATDVSPAKPPDHGLERPVDGPVITPFGVVFSETFKDYRWHRGLDLSAGQGTEVRAAASGTVTGIARDPFLGLILTLDHGGKVSTVYGNLSTVLVAEDDYVSQGEAVARVGGSAAGESREEPHLHFEVSIDSERVDPEPLFR